MSDKTWTGCVHCGQTLPHEGTGWRESSRCRLFQRIAEQAWDEGYDAGYNDCLFDTRGLSSDPDAAEFPHSNPYRTSGDATTEEAE